MHLSPRCHTQGRTLRSGWPQAAGASRADDAPGHDGDDDQSRERGGDRERGGLSLMLVVLFVALTALAGIVVDGGAKLMQTRTRSRWRRRRPGQAPRPSTSQPRYSSGSFVVSQQQALAAARSYLIGAGYDRYAVSAGRLPRDQGYRDHHRANPVPVAHRGGLIHLYRHGDRVAGDRRDRSGRMTRARSVSTGLAALAVLAAAVIGLPVVLYRFGGSPLPRHIASWHGVIAALSSQDSGGLLLAIVRDCSWLAWLLFTACVLAEAKAAIRGRRPPYLRLGGLQGIAAHLVALAALAFAAPSAITLSASAAAVSSQAAGPQPGHGQPVDRQPANGQPANGQPGAGDSSRRYLGSPPAEYVDAASATASRLVTVRSGDCLWSIAQRYLGAGDRYPAIVSLNYGEEMGDGQVFTNPSLIEPGWRLFLPGHGSDGQTHSGREPSHGDRHGPAGRGRSQHAGHPTRTRITGVGRRGRPAARGQAARGRFSGSERGRQRRCWFGRPRPTWRIGSPGGQ